MYFSTTDFYASYFRLISQLNYAMYHKDTTLGLMVLQAEAIRKILGQDSSRKKQEDKMKKRQEVLAQERAANNVLASNAVRWVIGPSGTTVTFPDEIGLPRILESKPCSYPPPRENCAGPSCTNAYKYRDSKSKLPLCSLGCYKAIHERMQTTAACLI